MLTGVNSTLCRRPLQMEGNEFSGQLRPEGAQYLSARSTPSRTIALDPGAVISPCLPKWCICYIIPFLTHFGTTIIVGLQNTVRYKRFSGTEIAKSKATVEADYYLIGRRQFASCRGYARWSIQLRSLGGVMNQVSWQRNAETLFIPIPAFEKTQEPDSN
ncbi:hypothetical protein L211DRAFT_615938 [Terfezia boudieri ATCC MYA-4762]|uniref:Uncharacterized protein n=1 Tax=Terfezia boudieri ATCC MYA-4762 TaxID=1051890 RepID=A0A3N4M1E4_9PEZI|nr:hypothetical protein L211DRAFT_615938 [Terfezia boudieri ATCC MYA-4762]